VRLEPRPPRYQTQVTRPAIIFVAPTPTPPLACVREADIHHRDLSALALTPLPPGLRERLTGERDLEVTRVALLPDPVAQAARDGPHVH
jgi:hypothetical protein